MEMDWPVWMATQFGGGELRGYWGKCLCYHSCMGASLRTHKQRTLSEGNPQLRSSIGSYSIGDKASGEKLSN